MGKGGGEGGGGVKGGLGVMEIFMRDLTDGTEQGGGVYFVSNIILWIEFLNCSYLFYSWNSWNG